MQIIIHFTYICIWCIVACMNTKNITNKPNYAGDRNKRIYERFKKGARAETLAVQYKISFGRVLSIIKQQKFLEVNVDAKKE